MVSYGSSWATDRSNTILTSGFILPPNKATRTTHQKYPLKLLLSTLLWRSKVNKVGRKWLTGYCLLCRSRGSAVGYRREEGAPRPGGVQGQAGGEHRQEQAEAGGTGRWDIEVKHTNNVILQLVFTVYCAGCWTKLKGLYLTMRSWWMLYSLVRLLPLRWRNSLKSAWRTRKELTLPERYKTLTCYVTLVYSLFLSGLSSLCPESIYSLLLDERYGSDRPHVSVLTGCLHQPVLELYWEEFTASKAIWENTISQWLPHIRFLPVRIYHRLPPSNYLPPVSSIDTPVEVCLKRINCYFPSKCVSRSWRQPLESTQTSTTSFCVEEWLVTYSWILNVDDLWECVLYVRYWTERLRWTTLASGSMTCCGTTSLN